MLTGHGCYREYRYKYGHNEDKAGPEYRNERTRRSTFFFTFPQYIDQQNCLERKIGFQITPNNIVNLMLTSFNNWNLVCVFAKRVLAPQRLADRERSAELEDSTRWISTPEVVLNCGPIERGQIVRSVTNEIGFSTHAFSKPTVRLVANGVHW